MLSRSFGINHISDITNSLNKSISSLSGSKTNLTNVTDAKTAQNLLASAANKSSSNTMNNETASVLNEVCSGSGFNKYSDDYLKYLERQMGMRNGLNICNDNNLSELDRLLMLSTGMNASRRPEYKSMVNKMIGNEMGAIGYSGSIPSCLYGKVESLIDSLLSGINGNINLKLDLMKFLNNKCLNETLGAISNSNLSSKISGLFTDSMLSSGNKDAAVNYMGTKYSQDPNSALNALGSSISGNNNSDNASTKLMMYSSLEGSNSGLNTTSLNKSNIIDNLNNDTTINKNSKGVMDSMGSVFSTNDSSLFSNKPNLNNSASSYLSNNKSTDSLNSTSKSGINDLPTTIKLANLFG